MSFILCSLISISKYNQQLLSLAVLIHQTCFSPKGPSSVAISLVQCIYNMLHTLSQNILVNTLYNLKFKILDKQNLLDFVTTKNGFPLYQPKIQYVDFLGFLCPMNTYAVLPYIYALLTHTSPFVRFYCQLIILAVVLSRRVCYKHLQLLLL
jgi:hypothetical protein